MPKKPIARTICPLCGWNRVIKRKGTSAAASGRSVTRSKGLFHYGEIGLDGFKLIRWMISHGRCSKEDQAAGKLCGFQPINAKTFDEVVNDPTWSWVIDDIYARVCEMKERIENARSNGS
jgi:hypothetical protein